MLLCFYVIASVVKITDHLLTTHVVHLEHLTQCVYVPDKKKLLNTVTYDLLDVWAGAILTRLFIAYPLLPVLLAVS